ncbi:hypothetical protein QTO30_17280 [Yoonia sp. GPGPB17]|uniref:hypothetical protein n=1 Tax=Yoonia sp. GPGPB17 TaxID=3026147 RepID=UPI0030BBC23D
MSSAFFSALRSRDVSKATELGQMSGNWPALAMGAITQLDQIWQDDTLPIGEIAETYWTLRRTLDELTTTSAEFPGNALSIGRAIIYIPDAEQHTFGPQMLVDKVMRMGWDAQLYYGFGSESLMKRLSTESVDVVGISVGTDSRLDGLADLILDVKQYSMNADIKTLIGGNAISGASDQYGFLGADWVATSTQDALQFFERDWSKQKLREGRFNG